MEHIPLYFYVDCAFVEGHHRFIHNFRLFRNPLQSSCLCHNLLSVLSGFNFVDFSMTDFIEILFTQLSQIIVYTSSILGNSKEMSYLACNAHPSCRRRMLFGTTSSPCHYSELVDEYKQMQDTHIIVSKGKNDIPKIHIHTGKRIVVWNNGRNGEK